MIKKINILLIFLLLLIVSLGAVSAADNSNESLAINEIDNGDNILTASEHSVTPTTYSQYFSSNGQLIDSAVNVNDTITLSGDFSGKDFIINKPITLQGSESTISNGIVRFNSGASGSVIHDLKIKNTENFHQGIYLVGADNCEIYNNNIVCTGQSSYPIALIEEANNNNIHDNFLKGYGESYGHGTRSVPVMLLGRSNDNVIADNNIEVDDANAIYLSSYAGGEFKGGESYNNIIRDNTIRYMVNVTSWAYGIQLMGGNNTVDSNKIYGAYRGVSSSNFPLNKIINNIIYVTGTDFSSHAVSGGDYGIAVAANATIRNNTVNGAFIGAAISGGDGAVIENNYVNATKGYGIEAPGDNIKVVGNEIHSASAGVHQQGQCEGIVVDRNVIFSGNAVGVLLSKSSKTKYPSNIRITNNDITTSNQYIINAADADKDTWYIKNNTGGKELTPEGEVDPSVPDFVFNGTTHYITPDNYHNYIDENGNLKNDFVHDGDILNFDGTFNDKEILVSSSVKVTGKNPTFLNSTFIVTSDSVWIENLTIINKNASVHSAWGIYVADAQIVKLLNNDITVYDPTSAYAIYVYQSSRVYVEDNKLTSHGDSLTYTLLGYGAEECEFKNNVVNCIGTGEIHAFENSKDINGNGSEVCIGQCIGHCLGDILKEHCLDGTNIVPELYRTYGILMIKSSNNTLTENDVFVTSLVNQSLAVNSTNSLVGIDFYYDCDNNLISKNTINVTGLDNYLYGAGALARSTGGFASTTAINNTFISNDIYVTGPNVGEGFILGEGCDDTKITSNFISLNCGRTVYGITLEMSHDSTITGNIIGFNSPSGYGIEGFESNNNIIENNLISGEGKVISGIAAIRSNNTIIQNNAITSNGNGDSLDFIVRDSINAPNSGIFFAGVSKGNFIDSNIITTLNGYPVDLSAVSSGNTVTYNYLKGKEGSGDEGVNNSKGNTVHDNYVSTFNNLVMDNVTAKYNSQFTVTVKTDNAANGANVEFSLGDLILGNATVSNGQASLTYKLNKDYNVGNYTIVAALSKHNFKSEEISANLEITKADVNINVEDVTANTGDTVPITAVVLDSNGQPISNVEVKFQRNSNFIGSATTDKDGKAVLNAKIPTSLAEGNYVISAVTAESNNYNSAIGNATLTVLDASKTSTKITVNDITMYVKDGTRLAGTITDSNGKPVSGLDVNITINGVHYTRTSDDKGQFSMALNLDAGKYDVSFVFNGNSKYRASNASSTVTIKPTLFGNDIVKMYKNATRYVVFVLKDGKPQSNVDVLLNINGVIYTRKTDNLGMASLAINLNPGNYTITAQRGDTGERLSNNIEVKSLLVENKDIEMFYRNGTGYTVKVIKQDGTVAGAGETVTFNINGVFYERQTNNEGIARLNLNLQPGNYIITAEYKDCRVSNNIKILPVLSAKDLTKKYGEKSPFIVNLVDGHGKPLANKNVSFNINGVFYIRSTDGEGIARLNINLMPGKYIITSSYNEANIANTVTVTP